MNDTGQDAEPHEECQTPRSARAVSEAENHQLLQLGITHHQAPPALAFYFFSSGRLCQKQEVAKARDFQILLLHLRL